jgi:hypothetical protein
MNHLNFQHRHLISAFLCVGMLISSTSSMLAEPSPRQENKAMTQANNSKTSYTNRGQPQVQTGQASRGSCTSGIDANELLAYVPLETVEAYPTFQFQVPFDPQSFHSIEFVLMEENAEAKIMYETQLNVREFSPEVQISLPQPSTELEVDQSYVWKLIVHCSVPTSLANLQDSIYVEGSIKRVQLTPESETEN